MKLNKKVQRLINKTFPLRLGFGEGKNRIKTYNEDVKELADNIIRVIEDELNKRRTEE